MLMDMYGGNCTSGSSGAICTSVVAAGTYFNTRQPKCDLSPHEKSNTCSMKMLGGPRYMKNNISPL